MQCVYTTSPITLHFSEGGAFVSGAYVFRIRGRDTHGAAELLTCNNSLPGESISCGGGFLQGTILFRDTGRKRALALHFEFEKKNKSGDDDRQHGSAR